MMNMRKPIDEDEAAYFFNAWKKLYLDAFNVHTKAALMQALVFDLDVARKVAMCATISADCTLARLVEEHDKVKSAWPQEEST